MSFMGGSLLILDKLCSRGLVHCWLSVVFLAAIVVISHTQVGMAADHERMPSEGSTNRNGLEKNELGTTPFINKRVSVVRASRVVAGKSEECVTIDINRLHVKRPVSFNRLYFDKVSSWPFEDSRLNRILQFRVVIVGESDVSDFVYVKCRTSSGTLSCYLLELVELEAIPFVDDWLCWVGTSIMIVCHCEIFVSI